MALSKLTEGLIADITKIITKDILQNLDGTQGLHLTSMVLSVARSTLKLRNWGKLWPDFINEWHEKLGWEIQVTRV